MSGLMHKIKDAVTGHHTTTNTTTAAHGTHNAPLANTNAPLANNAAMANNTAVGATPLGSAQVKDIPVEHNHGTASGAMKGAAAGALAGHPVAGAAVGAAAGHHANKDHHLHSASSSSLHSSNAGALGTGAALGAGAVGASHLGSTHTGSSHLATGTHTTGSHIPSEISHDNAMTRSEEHLLVGKEQVNLGKAGLHKYVTSEHVATTVPVVRERAVVEREPITEANRAAAVSGPDFKEAHHEVNLMAERVVTQKEEVPIERVRLRKEQEVTNQYVEADLRKEHIEVADGTKTLGSGLETGSSRLATDVNSQSRRM